MIGSTAMIIGRFARWCLSTLKKTWLGIGGIALLVVVGLFVAGAFVAEPLRWYLIGVAGALLLFCGAMLALSYARYIIDRFVCDQRTQISEINGSLRESVAELKEEISDTKNTLMRLNVGNLVLFQRFNRRLTNEDLKRLQKEWMPKLGLDLDTRALGYMAHHICVAEDTCTGRMAGDIEDMVLRILIARSIEEPGLDVLEIGTLFGVSIAILYDNCRGLFTDLHITVIDPLQGYYDQPSDPLTMVPVTRDMFVHNMRRMSIPESDYTIIPKLSTEDEAIEQASRRRYNLLIIDGDHSYTGVKHDFLSYRHLVKRAGYIVFDNYDDPNCPGVKDFVDKEVAGLPELECVGTDGITAVFRVVASRDLAKQSAATIAAISTEGDGNAGAPSPVLTVRGTAPGSSVDYPKQVAFETSTICNAHCDFCPSDKLARRGHVMEMELIEKLISDLAEIPPPMLPEIVPNGVNEPLADKRILDVLDQISSQLPDARVYFVTNGNLLTEKAITELSKHNLSKLCISLNFCDKNNYEQRTGLQWTKTLTAMSTLHEKVTSGEFRHTVHISRVGDGGDYDSRFASWVRAKYPAFQPWVKRAGDWLGSIPNLSPESHEARSKCPQWHFVHIASTGVVRRCCMDADVEYPWGDLKTMNLLDIFNQDAWRALRRGEKSRSEVEPCKKCTYY